MEKYTNKCKQGVHETEKKFEHIEGGTQSQKPRSKGKNNSAI